MRPQRLQPKADGEITILTRAQLRERHQAKSRSALEEEGYRRGYCDGFIAAYNAIEDEMERGGIAQILHHMFEFWQYDLIDWKVGNTGYEEPPDFALPEDVCRKPLHRTLRQQIIDRCDFRCRYCGRCNPSYDADPDGKRWHIDHVIPLAGGGTHTEQNMTLACARCNQKKGARR